MAEPFLIMVVGKPIPDSRGIETKKSAAQNGQISFSLGDILAPRSVGDRVAGLRA
jgi:hypothetical protein